MTSQFMERREHKLLTEFTLDDLDKASRVGSHIGYFVS